MSLNHFTSQSTPGGIFNPRFNSLIVDNGISNSNQPLIVGYNTTAQSITSGTTSTPCTYTSVTTVGTGLSYSSGTFSLSSSGTYAITAYTLFPAAATGLRVLSLYVNGSQYVLKSLDASATSAATPQTELTINLPANSTVQVLISQTSGGALNCNNTGYVSIYKLS